MICCRQSSRVRVHGSQDDQGAPRRGRGDQQGRGESGAEGGRRRRRRRGRGGERGGGGAAGAGRGGAVRPRAHGQADAGHGWPRGDEADPGHGGDHADRRRVERRPPRGRRGVHHLRRRRLHVQASVQGEAGNHPCQI